MWLFSSVIFTSFQTRHACVTVGFLTSQSGGTKMQFKSFIPLLLGLTLFTACPSSSVNPPSFDLTIAPASVSAKPGETTAKISINIGRKNGFSANIATTFATNSILGKASNQVSVNTIEITKDSGTLEFVIGALVTPQVYSLQLNATAEGVTKTANISLEVKPSVAPPSNNTISGTIYAPAGGDIKDTFVLACYFAANNCDSNKSDAGKFTVSGSKADYSFTNLAAGDYVVLALQGQLDQAGNIIAVDAFAVYAKGDNGTQKYTFVKPTSDGIDLRLVSVANPDAGNAATVPGSASPLPSELQGEFFIGSSASSNFYNPSTGVFAPASGGLSSHTFNADGTFTDAVLLQNSFYGCTTSVYSYRTGFVILNGTQMTRNYLSGTIKYTDSCNPTKNYERPAKLGSVTEAWRVGADPQYPDLRYLYLTDDTGKEIGYLKKK
jgi:hypothetical protein